MRADAEKRRIKSVDRTMALLGHLRSADGPLTLTELPERVMRTANVVEVNYRSLTDRA